MNQKIFDLFNNLNVPKDKIVKVKFTFDKSVLK